VATDTAEEAVSGATTVLAAARSHGERPIVSMKDLPLCTTLISVGSTVPSQRELDTSIIAGADFIVCDVPEEVTSETGDFLAASREQVPFHNKVHSLTELLSGDLLSIAQQARLAVFKSVGSGIQDVAIASLALERALRADLATPLPIAFEGR
jgi:ornithine cyclodeaminase/alanine dehydrogenase